MQANEELRISKENLHKHPFIDLELTETPLDVETFYKEVQKQGLVNTIATENSLVSGTDQDESSLLANNNSINLTTKGTE